MTSTQEIKNRASKLPPIDQTMQLPAAIRAAAARSEALHKEAYQAAEPTVEPTVAPEATATPTTPENVTPEVVVVATTPQPTGATKDDWEHRYNSLRGRYDKDQQTIAGLTSRIGQLEAALTSKPQPVQPNPDLQFKPLITDKDKEDFGADFIDVAQRAALEKVNPEIAALKAQLARLEGNVGSIAATAQVQQKKTVHQTLDEKMPNWREINRDQKFLAWANLPDGYSGAIRIGMMRDAFEQGDAERVLRFFKGFLSEEAAPTPATATQPDTRVTTQGNTKVPLETFAAPGRATTAAATTAPAEKETISRAQIAAFYSEVNRGKYRGNEAEKNRLEQMIFDAERDGRIVD